MKKTEADQKTYGKIFIEVIDSLSKLGRWILAIFFCIFIPLTWFSVFWSSIFTKHFQWINTITLFAVICVSLKIIIGKKAR